MSFEEQEAALRPEPEPEGKKKSKGLGGALKKIFGKKKDKAPKAAPLEMEIGGPTDVQRVPQPLERVMAHLGTDPEVAKLVRFDGMTLKLDRSALPEPDAGEEVDPTKPKVGIPTPGEVLDLSTLPFGRNSGAFEEYETGHRRHTGAMVHVVKPEVDVGPVLAFDTVAIPPTLDALEADIHALEHRLVVLAARRFFGDEP